jgi:hypothetical protein
MRRERKREIDRDLIDVSDWYNLGVQGINNFYL